MHPHPGPAIFDIGKTDEENIEYKEYDNLVNASRASDIPLHLPSNGINDRLAHICHRLLALHLDIFVCVFQLAVLDHAALPSLFPLLLFPGGLPVIP